MRNTLRTFATALLCLGVLGARLHADVIKLSVEKREPFTDGGVAYEKLTGHFFGELDPKHPLNAIVTDIEHAPRNARGRVEYSATFTILKPVDMSKGTGVLVYQVPNRGRGNIEGGGYFADFRARGHVLVASGWQADIRPGEGIESMVAPIARNADGSSITGPVMARIADAAAGTNTQPIIRGRVTGTATPASLDTSKATLTRRMSEGGSRVPLRADEWAFADCAKAPFPGHAGPGEDLPEGRIRSGGALRADLHRQGSAGPRYRLRRHERSGRVPASGLVRRVRWARPSGTRSPRAPRSRATTSAAS